MTRKKDFSKDFHHWNICSVCAKLKGGKVLKGQVGITVTRGTCQYCKIDDVTLIPLLDFNWPKYDMSAWFD